MRLPTPPSQYDPIYESQKNLLIEQADLQNHKRQADMEIVEPQRLILRSPNGTKYVISVNNSGVLSATAL